MISFRIDWFDLLAIQGAPKSLLRHHNSKASVVQPSPFFGLPCGSAGKESACSGGDLGLILGLGRSPGEEKGYPLEYSSLENSMDCVVHGVANRRTATFTFLLPFGNAENFQSHKNSKVWTFLAVQ